MKKRLIDVQRLSCVLILCFTLISSPGSAQPSIARIWNETLLKSIRQDFARPTVHARNLFHTSAAMYDAWAVFDEEAQSYLLGKKVKDFEWPFEGFQTAVNPVEARRQAISYAMYRLLRSRFVHAPGKDQLFRLYNNLMLDMGLDTTFISTDYRSGNPAALGNYIAAGYIQFGLQDGSNEAGLYQNTYYKEVNQPLVMDRPGNPGKVDPNRWQPLKLEVFIDQSGNVLPITFQSHLGPEWGWVAPFALPENKLVFKQRDGQVFPVYYDPGPPPYLDTTQITPSSQLYQWGFSLVSAWSAHLDARNDVPWDVSPGNIGNIRRYPQKFEDYPLFYDIQNGLDAGEGHAVNPVTGQPYTPQIVPRGDYTRALAEFWADGPDSETPPGHWFKILNAVSDHPLLKKQWAGKSTPLDALEWDVKTYLALGGAVHDAAITAWGIKGFYDYVRPVSAIRFMADRGQSSDPGLPRYHPGGIPLMPGLIELVQPDELLAGPDNENVGKIKLRAWRGPNFIFDPDTDVAGVGWVLAENWWPYQRPTFVSPPFAGYISGHSTFSSAAAMVLTAFTGDPFFPGGMGVFKAPKDSFLVFERGPSTDLELQWATYKDAADQCSLSRIWGGIHPPQDDMPGRIIGQQIGENAFHLAEKLFFQDKDQDGYLSYNDCDDADPEIHPDATEVVNGKDNNCDGLIDNIITSISGLTQEAIRLEIYPNPAIDVLFVENLSGLQLQLQSFSINGTAGVLPDFDLSPGEKQRFSVNSLPAGTYLLRFFSSDGAINGHIRWIKQ